MYMLIIFIILLFDIETITVTETFIKENLEQTISFFFLVWKNIARQF